MLLNPDSRASLIGESAGMQEVLRLVGKASRGRWPVLLLGETGTGKEIVARAIHNQAPAGNFVTIDCSAIVGPLMESELFGHVRGAFTGATTAKTGLIEIANSGTAFFDEIGELSPDLQMKLLRVLQEKEFRPVGSLQHRRSDFRIIAATNRDLAREVERGNFRQDLYFRLKVVTVRLPPLRERPEDLEILIEHFIRRYGKGHLLADGALQAMRAYSWPGNVRELEHCIMQMVAMNTGPYLHQADLPSAVLNGLLATRQCPANGPGDPPGTAQQRVAPSYGHTGEVIPLHELERRAILHALEYAKGDRVMAAQLLQIGKTTLYRKLKEYSLSGKDPRQTFSPEPLARRKTAGEI